jgi:DNA-binding MarR family transcriptional regulator
MDDLERKRSAWHAGCGGIHAEPQPPASALRHEPLQRIFKAVHRSFLQHALRRMRAEGIVDLYPGATSLLLHLEEDDGLTLSELARRCDLENSTLTPLVDELERHELVRRARTTEDRRVVQLFLTARGRDLAPRLRVMWLALQEQALQGVTEEEVATMYRIMARMVENLNAESL